MEILSRESSLIMIWTYALRMKRINPFVGIWDASSQRTVVGCSLTPHGFVCRIQSMILSRADQTDLKQSPCSNSGGCNALDYDFLILDSSFTSTWFKVPGTRKPSSREKNDGYSIIFKPQLSGWSRSQIILRHDCKLNIVCDIIKKR